MLVYNPTFLFVWPGLLALLLGVVIMPLALAHVSIFGQGMYLHTLIGGSLLLVLGSQLIGFGLCGRTYAVYQLGDRDPWLERMQARFRLEHGLVVRRSRDAGGHRRRGRDRHQVGRRADLGDVAEQRAAVLAATLVIVGVQIFFTSFLLSMLGLRRRSV